MSNLSIKAEKLEHISQELARCNQLMGEWRMIAITLGISSVIGLSLPHIISYLNNYAKARERVANLQILPETASVSLLESWYEELRVRVAAMDEKTKSILAIEDVATRQAQFEEYLNVMHTDCDGMRQILRNVVAVFRKANNIREACKKDALEDSQEFATLAATVLPMFDQFSVQLIQLSQIACNEHKKALDSILEDLHQFRPELSAKIAEGRVSDTNLEAQGGSNFSNAGATQTGASSISSSSGNPGTSSKSRASLVEIHESRVTLPSIPEDSRPLESLSPSELLTKLQDMQKMLPSDASSVNIFPFA